jgi:arylsulfatase A
MAGRETMREDETTLAEALEGAGYRTGIFGKWHLGQHYPYVPHAQGFDEFVGFRTSHWNNYFDSDLERNGEPVKMKGYIADALTDEAIRFMVSSGSQPFFVYLPYNLPHLPFQLPERYYKMYEGADIPDRTKAAYGMCTNLDDNIGRLLTRMDELGIADDTIFIFLTDNGPNGQRFNSGLRGRKSSVYEGGVRVPFFIRWPGRFEGGWEVDRIAAHIDIYPTILSLCGVRRPEGLPIDGVDISPLLEGAAEDWPDRMLFTHRERRTDPMAMYPGVVRTQCYNLVNGKELYDIENDPGEQNDVAEQHPEIVAELRTAYEAWFRDVSTERKIGPRPIPVGYWEENPVRLPAPQSCLHGNAKFHQRTGWAHDWITNWKGLEDSVHWDINVVHSGSYEVAVQYLCPEADVGSRIRVSAAGRIAEATISEATSMAPKPRRDAIPRRVAPEMNWGALVLGTVRLDAGETKLIVNALSKPGDTVMDLKAVVLRRLE